MEKEQATQPTGDFIKGCFMDDDKITELKMEINNLIWTHSPHHTTLKQADLIACNALEMVLNGKTSYGETDN